MSLVWGIWMDLASGQIGQNTSVLLVCTLMIGYKKSRHVGLVCFYVVAFVILDEQAVGMNREYRACSMSRH